MPSAGDTAVNKIDEDLCLPIVLFMLACRNSLYILDINSLCICCKYFSLLYFC